MKTDKAPKEQILIVENQVLDADAMQRTLELEKYAVTVVSNVKDGIAQVRRLDPTHEHHCDFAVVIIDLSFERAGDEEVNAEGMKVFVESLNWPFLEPVIATAFPSLETSMKAANEGTFRYITKGEGLASRLVKVVNTAVAVRRANLEMEDRLSRSNSLCADLRAKGADPVLVSDLQENIRKMRESFWAMLRSRGKNPPSTVSGH